MKRKSAALNQSFAGVAISVSAKNAFMLRGLLSETSKIQKREYNFKNFKFGHVNNGIVFSWTLPKVLKGY